VLASGQDHNIGNAGDAGQSTQHDPPRGQTGRCSILDDLVVLRKVGEENANDQYSAKVSGWDSSRIRSLTYIESARIQGFGERKWSQYGSWFNIAVLILGRVSSRVKW